MPTANAGIKKPVKKGGRCMEKFYLVPDECWVTVPVVGVADAGRPTDWMLREGSRRIRPVEGDRLGKRTIAVQARGVSMTGDDIRDGDWLILRTRVWPHELDKQIVVVRTHEGMAVKRVVAENDGDTVWLVSSNPEIKPMPYVASEVFVVGLVVRLERDFE